MLKYLLALALCIPAPQSFAQEPNTVQVINHGVAAFQKRFEMIERAQKSIDVEYFIYNTDEAGRLFTQALIKKKIQNPEVQIRILLDASGTVLQLKDSYISMIESFGIEIRYYNPISLLMHFSKAQYRDHRKLIVIDSQEAITGSRNIADEYFDLHPKFNFRDRDIWVSGPIARTMKDSFDEYWAGDQTFEGPKLTSVHTSKKLREVKKAEDYVIENAHDRFLRSEIKRVGDPILADPRSQGTCDSLSYVTDRSGFQTPAKRKVLPKLFGRLNEMKEGDKLYIESPYFIIHDKDAFDEMANLKGKNISAVLLTNSLASTDAFYVAANFYPRTSFYQSLSHSQMYIFEGKTPDNTPFVKMEDGTVLTKDAVWGIHSKTFVFSDSSFAIGTFNIDPRSANLNSEMLMFCEGSKALTSFVVSDMEARITQADLLGEDGKLSDGKSIFDGVGVMKKIKFVLAILPSEWFSYLL